MDLRWKCQWNQGLGRDFVKDERLAPQRMPWWEFFGAEGMNNGNATILGPTPEKLWESSQRSGFLFKGYPWYPLISLGIVVTKLNRKTQHNTYLLFKKNIIEPNYNSYSWGPSTFRLETSKAMSHECAETPARFELKMWRDCSLSIVFVDPVYIYHTHMLHVWYIYLHLGHLWGKCW